MHRPGVLQTTQNFIRRVHQVPCRSPDRLQPAFPCQLLRRGKTGIPLAKGLQGQSPQIPVHILPHTRVILPAGRRRKHFQMQAQIRLTRQLHHQLRLSDFPRQIQRPRKNMPLRSGGDVRQAGMRQTDRLTPAANHRHLPSAVHRRLVVAALALRSADLQADRICADRTHLCNNGLGSSALHRSPRDE